MAFDYTVRQCAERLGVTEQRVHQLIKEGLLPAEFIAGRYFVDEGAVEARAIASPAPGRPPKRLKQDPRCFTLMNRTHEVFDFTFDAASNEFVEVTDISDPERAPLGMMSPRGKKASLSALTYWWRHRSIPISRAGMDAKLSELGISDPSRIPFDSLGLSLSDQYWIRPEGSAIHWEAINFFYNPFAEMRMNDWLDQVGLDSPDNTSEGQLSKRWIYREGSPVLLKGGTTRNQEPYNEAVATRLHQRLLSPEDFTPYEIEHLPNGEAASACTTFVTDEEEYIPAYYVMRTRPKEGRHSAYQHYLECCARLGVEDAELALAKMIVTDDILGNTDRHLRNFGLIRNVETMEYRIAPLFDTGNSLLCDKPDAALRSGDLSFSTKPFSDDPNQQLRLVNDFSWLSLDALTGFAQQAEEVLAQNPDLEERLPFIEQFIEERITRIRIIAS